MTSSNSQNSFLRSLLEKERLRADGTNFIDWDRNLRIILKHERREYVLDNPIPEDEPDKAKQDEVEAYQKHLDNEHEVNTLMLAMMDGELQKQFLENTSYFIMGRLKEMFQEQARHERHKVTMDLISCKMQEGSSVSAHVLKMLSMIAQLERLNSPVSKQLATDFILGSLPPSFSGFKMNYNMNGWDKSLQELHAMLKTAEADIKKSSSSVLVVSKDSGKSKGKNKGKRKAKKVNGKGKNKVETKGQPQAKKAKVASDAECFHCHEKGHWKRNCPKYLEDKKAGKVPSTSGIFVIEINLATSFSDWVLDTGSCAHICSNVQALSKRRMLNKGEVQLRVGNGASVAAIAIGCVELCLPSGLVLNLSSVYFVPSISKNIISISC